MDDLLSDESAFVVVLSSPALAEEVRRLVKQVINDGSPPRDDAPRGANGASAALTPRELEVLRLVARGRSNHQIANTLWVSQDTVRFHLRNAYRKLGVHSREAAVERAALGLIAD